MIKENGLVPGQLGNDDVERRLSRVIAQASFTRVPADAIQMTHILSEIGIDSLGFMEVVVCVEEEFDITVADEDLAMERFETVESLRDYVISKMPVSVSGSRGT